MHTDRIPEDARTEVVHRLRRAEGQVRAVARTIESGGDCVAVLRQITAAKRAVERAGARLIAAGLVECIAASEEGDLLPAEFEKLFLELA